nr:hypothetical protein [Cytophagales bacterium]
MKKVMDNFWKGMLGLLLVAMFPSCLPEAIEDQPTIDNEVITLAASPTFEWATSRLVEVKIEGLTLPITISRRLTLKTGDGNIIYANSHPMTEDLTLSFSLPNHIEEVKMIYGTLEKIEEIKDQKVAFNYIVQMDNSDVD